ncbi:MAG: alanine--glyoxylate aminotransferase family protein [Nitrospirae bacterium]|nr:MAG: alanine--glyoxylate aminotransferase family protein [Nitrospirota bacterium]
MIKKYLLAPGPTPVPPEVLSAMSMPIIHHRSEDFIPVLEDAKNGLKWLFKTENDVLILCSTGTGGMVGSVNNFFSPGEKALVVNGGKFGERWAKICRAYGMTVEEIKVEWGYAVDPDDIRRALERDPDIKGVFIQATETSTGVNHDIASIADIVRRYDDTLFVVDAISALVAHDIKIDDWGLDIVVGGSQKGLMLPPGLSFVSVSEKAWQRSENSKAKRFYFDFKKERASLSKNQTNFTSAVTLIIGLNESLKLLKKEGLENVFKRHAMLARATREAMRAIGLELFAKESPSNSLTAVEAPEGFDGQEIYKRLRVDYGVTTAGGQDKVRGKIFRIAHLGYADVFDIIIAVSAVEMVLRDMGYPVKLGSGVAKAEEVFGGTK